MRAKKSYVDSFPKKSKVVMPLVSGSGSSPGEQHLDEAVGRLGGEFVLPGLSISSRSAVERPEIDFLGDPVSDFESPEFSEGDSDAEFPSKGELLERILREHARRDKDGRKFWPYALLARLMVKEQLRSILLAEFEWHKVDPMLERLGLLYDSAGDAPSLHDPLQTREAEAADRRDGYLRVFAILTLLGRLDSLPRFLKAKLNDADLLNLYVDEHPSRCGRKNAPGPGQRCYNGAQLHQSCPHQPSPEQLAGEVFGRRHHTAYSIMPMVVPSLDGTRVAAFGQFSHGNRSEKHELERFRYCNRPRLQHPDMESCSPWFHQRRYYHPISILARTYEPATSTTKPAQLACAGTPQSTDALQT